MIGLDTNILVRYITQDEPTQAALATRLIEGRCTKAEPARIAQVVPCESDYLLALGNLTAGCEVTFTFDTRLGKHSAAALVRSASLSRPG